MTDNSYEDYFLFVCVIVAFFMSPPDKGGDILFLPLMSVFPDKMLFISRHTGYYGFTLDVSVSVYLSMFICVCLSVCLSVHVPL